MEIVLVSTHYYPYGNVQTLSQFQKNYSLFQKIIFFELFMIYAKKAVGTLPPKFPEFGLVIG